MSARLTRRATAALLKAGTLPAMLTMNRHAKSYYTVEFIAAGMESGVFEALSLGPRTVDALMADLDVDPAMEDGLAAWLDLGVSLGLLARRGRAYGLRRAAAAVLDPGNDPVVAFYTELSHLHHRLIGETPVRLREGRPFELADADSALIARTSRMSGPYIEAVLQEVVPPEGPVRLVEVGCGSGAHIRTAAALNPQLTALGVELQAGAAEQARANLETWGLGDRVEVVDGDIRDHRGFGDADLVTLHQNIYYFGVDERVTLLRHLATFLRPGGQIVVTSIVRSGAHAAAALDLWGAMTRDTGRLPESTELRKQLVLAGYTDARADKVTPDGMFCAFVAKRPV